MASQHQPAARPPLMIAPQFARSPTLKNLSRHNSLTGEGGSPIPQPDEVLLRPEDEKEKAELDRDEERRGIFQKHSNEILKVPSGYRKVEVLIIRWHESIDEFKGHNYEIERLQTIFENVYGFKCRVAAIKNDRDPQTELDWQILSHIREYDDEDSLLIVYYTGHGNQVEENNERRLELAATQNFSGSGTAGCRIPSAYWDCAEAPLRNRAKGDVLAILDCCFASTAALKSRSPESRTYQMLAASSVDGATCGPGATSFTTALCESLEELSRDPNGTSFTVLKLLEQINLRRPAQPALLWDRLHHHNERSVMLGRLDVNPEREESFQKEVQVPEKASLVLRLSLKEADLGNKQIEDLARTLPGVCLSAGVQVRKMEWVKMKRRDPTRVLQLALDAFRGSRSASSPAVLQETNTIGVPENNVPLVQASPPQNPSNVQQRVVWKDTGYDSAEQYCSYCKLARVSETNTQSSIYSSKALMMVCLLMAVPYTIEDRVKMVLLAICIALVLTRSPQTVQELDRCLGCCRSRADEGKKSWLHRLSTW